MDKKIVPAKIDGKNITDDWIYEEFAKGEYVATQFGPDRRMAFYRGLALFEIIWKTGDNMFVFYSRNPFCRDEMPSLLVDIKEVLDGCDDIDYRMTTTYLDIYVSLYIK